MFRQCCGIGLNDIRCLAHHIINFPDKILNHSRQFLAAESVSAEISGVKHFYAAGFDAKCIGNECRVIDNYRHYLKITEFKFLIRRKCQGRFQSLFNPAVFVTYIAYIFDEFRQYILGHFSYEHWERLRQVCNLSYMVAMMVYYK